MTCSSSSHRVCYFLPLNALLLLILTATQMRFMAQGRGISKPLGFSKRGGEEEVGAIISAHEIGSRPPRCERRCISCAHCEAVQVPANPQVKVIKTRNKIMYERGRDDHDSSNYKPLSWKCKCGNSIFNP